MMPKLRHSVLISSDEQVAAIYYYFQFIAPNFLLCVTLHFQYYYPILIIDVQIH